MYTRLFLVLCLLHSVLRTTQNDNFEVMDVSCGLNEEVSCLFIKCPKGQNCPTQDFCYNPKCICRRGYGRVHGVCLKKQNTRQLGEKNTDL